MMATMRCDHPDIEDFVDAKRDPARLRMFNLSVLITDPFMAAVKADASWDLTFDGKVYRTVQAKALWNRMMQATYDVAEPGVIFIDRINAANNLSYCEKISATNPCGEQPLPPYGACLLGSINLAQLVRDRFTDSADIDEDELDEHIRIEMGGDILKPLPNIASERPSLASAPSLLTSNSNRATLTDNGRVSKTIDLETGKEGGARQQLAVVRT